MSTEVDEEIQVEQPPVNWAHTAATEVQSVEPVVEYTVEQFLEKSAVEKTTEQIVEKTAEPVDSSQAKQPLQSQEAEFSSSSFEESTSTATSSSTPSKSPANEPVADAPESDSVIIELPLISLLKPAEKQCQQMRPSQL